MIRLDLAALEALLANATPGTWSQHSVVYSVIQVGCELVASTIVSSNTAADAALIVAAVNALPELIARVRELERERDQAAIAMRERCADICSAMARERATDPTSWATAADCAAAIRALEP